jgi:hypothetical protein
LGRISEIVTRVTLYVTVVNAGVTVYVTLRHYAVDAEKTSAGGGVQAIGEAERRVEGK